MKQRSRRSISACTSSGTSWTSAAASAASCGWLQPLLPGTKLAASEIDEVAVSWIREHYPDVEMAAIANNGFPPAPFNDDRFDLVLAYSVFTHLSVCYQDAWLAELQR